MGFMADSAMLPSLFMLILLVVGILIHLPICVSLTVASVGTIVAYGIYPTSFAVQTLYSSSASYTLLSIPFFILAGDLMLYGGISEKLINFGKAMLGHTRGSLGVITVFCCAIFAALSGSGPATTAAIGGILVPAMIKDGYDRGFAGTVACSSGCLGPLIPPSIIFAMYGVTVNASIADMFAAGVIPGILLAFSLVIWVKFTCKRYGFGTVQAKTTGKERLAAVKDAIWALFAPVIILGGIYAGIATPTESAAIACVYALIVGIFVYKKLDFKGILKVLESSAVTTGTVLILMGGATLFGRILAMDGVPQMIADGILNVTQNKILILLLINLLLIVVGMLMETLTAVLILAPILLSIVTPLGMSPVQLGVMMSMNLVIGYVTPPVGANMFVALRIADCGISTMAKWLVQAVGFMLCAQLLVTFVPFFSEFLPGFLNSLR